MAGPFDDDPYALDTSLADSVFGDPFNLDDGGGVAEENLRKMREEWAQSGRFRFSDISSVLGRALKSGPVAAGAELGATVGQNADLLPEAILATLRGAAKTPARLATNAARMTASLLPKGSLPNTVEESLNTGNDVFAPGPGEDPGALAAETALMTAVPSAPPAAGFVRRAAGNSAINAGIGAVTGGETVEGGASGALAGAVLGAGGSLVGSGMRALGQRMVAGEADRFARLFNDYMGTSGKRIQRVRERVVPHLLRAQEGMTTPGAPSIGRQPEAAPLLRASSLEDIASYARERMGEASNVQREILDAVDPQLPGGGSAGVAGVPLKSIDDAVRERTRREALRVERQRTSPTDPSVGAALGEERLRELGLREPGAAVQRATKRADKLKGEAVDAALLAAEEGVRVAAQSGNPLRILNADKALKAAQAAVAARVAKKATAADNAVTSRLVTADPGRKKAYDELSRRLAQFAQPDASGEPVIPIRELRAIQRQWARDINSESWGSNLADSAQKEVKKRVYRIINDVTEGKFSDLKAWDKQFSFWADVLDVAKQQMQKEGAKRAGLGTRASEELAAGTVLGGRFGTILKTQAAMHLARIVSSSPANVSKLQPVRHELARALQADDWVTIGKLMTRAGIPISLGLAGPRQFQPVPLASQEQ